MFDTSSDVYLHSTMYLFQLDDYEFEPFLLFIYIPLCIYFNDMLEVFKWIPELIYIPLCIYFNEGVGDSDKMISSFTFHYVSISTLISFSSD